VNGPVFVDTSALYAVLDADDRNHSAAAATFGRLLDATERGDAELVTHGSVVVEAAALVQHRLGLEATRALLDALVPLHRLIWVDADLHAEAVTALLAADRRHVSLVDWTSFVVMRRETIDVAFAFDEDFWQQGYTPAS
jgi:predicted nucleic acid-binding protein